MTTNSVLIQLSGNDLETIIFDCVDRAIKLNQSAAPAPVEEAPLTVQQAADLLDVTTATVYDLVHRQRIVSHRPGKRLYFLRADLLEFVKNGRRTTTEELAANAASRPTRQPRKKGGPING